MGPFLPLSCILLKFYIKPQHSWRPHDRPFVVSYWNSTSNHNSFEIIMVIRRLYLIEILHQTTTYSSPLSLLLRCILLKFYIKPQLLAWLRMSNKRCILLKFYIKPQHPTAHSMLHPVVSYWNSTSNHNLLQEFVNCWRLYLIEILHQTTTVGTTGEWNSRLYLIEILHQTTTCSRFVIVFPGCILLKFYIKPQQMPAKKLEGVSCILLKFYIKPQRFDHSG